MYVIRNNKLETFLFYSPFFLKWYQRPSSLGAFHCVKLSSLYCCINLITTLFFCHLTLVSLCVSASIIQLQPALLHFFCPDSWVYKRVRFFHKNKEKSTGFCLLTYYGS